MLDKYGCKKLILLLLFIFFVGVFGLVFLLEFWILMLFCIVFGIVVGVLFVLILIYLVELLLVEKCGFMLSLF